MRGLYGQNEGNEVNINASAERIADIDSEGVHVGIKTEAQFREEMSEASGRDYSFRRLEGARIDAIGVKRGDRDFGVLIARNRQTEALKDLGKHAEEMLEAGFDLNVVRASLNAAPAIAANRANEARIVRGRILAPADAKIKIRMRGNASMYNISRDARVDESGVKIESIYGPANRK